MRLHLLLLQPPTFTQKHPGHFSYDWFVSPIEWGKKNKKLMKFISLLEGNSKPAHFLFPSQHKHQLGFHDSSSRNKKIFFLTFWRSTSVKCRCFYLAEAVIQFFFVENYICFSVFHTFAGCQSGCYFFHKCSVSFFIQWMCSTFIGSELITWPCTSRPELKREKSIFTTLKQ